MVIPWSHELFLSPDLGDLHPLSTMLRIFLQRQRYSLVNPLASQGLDT